MLNALLCSPLVFWMITKPLFSELPNQIPPLTCALLSSDTPDDVSVAITGYDLALPAKNSLYSLYSVRKKKPVMQPFWVHYEFPRQKVFSANS